ncbi:Undecaprenyl-phosphate galactosephosphotransferase [hydrothermal vent metagenome]|uniref:Undecaprenyl-phosphate galactosephosphotransferase n=1 Tax=hydrothermal vent metagenome TaxID=652676 RepID=A0A1W1BMC3_9ZZZZ
MLILGTKYDISQKEKRLLLTKVEEIYTICIKDKKDDELIDEIKSYLSNHKVEFIVLNLEKKVSMRIKGYLEELEYAGIEIMLFSEFTSKFFNRCHIDFNEDNFDVYNSIHHDEFKLLTKRLFDILFSATALLLLSPLFLIIAILIKVKSPDGPVFFGHRRIGKDGKFFRVYKFRTMVPDAETRLKKLLDANPSIRKEYEKDFKLKNDPRIIPGIGNFMRKSSIDELPQFFNSLIGNMSVVGPRPIVEDEIPKYGKYAIKLYSVKPGVTGLWQVSGRNDINYDERVALDMEYIDNQSLWLDIKIIFQTVLVMIFRKGAY